MRNNIKKLNITTIFISIIVLCMIFFANTANAKLENEEQIKEELQKENDENPISTKYLVTDKYISCVNSETTIEKFKSNVQGVKVYETMSKEKEVTEGIIKTGMIAEYTKNGRTYNISVIGDLNKDGVLNQIDITREIRAILGIENWKIEEEIVKISADILRDSTLNEKDVKKGIDLIVLDKEENSFEMIEKPEIDIIGEYKEDRFITEVKIKILQKDKKGEKTVYKITGAENEKYREIKDTEEINLKRDGIYKVTAYTYGKDGNKSEEESIIFVIEKERYTVTYDLAGGTLEEEKTNPTIYTIETESFTLNNPSKVGYTFAGWTGSNGEEPEITVTIEQGSTGNKTYTANWTANTDTKYIIETYEMDLNGEYVKVNTEEKAGETDTEVSAEIITKEGFTYEETISTPNGIVAPDGSTVLKLYYSRNKYTVTLENGVGIESTEGAESYYYGATVTINADVKQGYTWSKWTSSNTLLIADSTSKTYDVTIPAGPVTLTAYGNNTPPTISLSVETVSPANLTIPSDGEYIIINGKGNKVSLNIDVKDKEDVNGVNDVTVQISNEAGSSFTDISDNAYGFYTVTITATDSAGAVTAKTVKINVFNAKQKFLDDVYRSVFNRGIDISGQNNWMSQLEEYGPDVVLLGIFASREMDERINDKPIWDESKKIWVQNYTYSNIDDYLKEANDLVERYIRLAYVTFLQRKVDVANENETPPGIEKVSKLKNKIKNGKWDEDRYNAYEYYKHCIDPENNGSVALGEFIGMFLNSTEYNNILHEYVKVDTASIETFRKSATGNNRGW